MLIGVPKEVKNREYRVGLVPASVRELVSRGHQVIVEAGAGNSIGLSDDMYREAGAELVSQAEEIFARAQMIVKVKEPQAHECKMLRGNQIIFTYLHLAPNPEQANLLLQSGAIAIAYETVTAADGQLPLLTPMSQVAGRMSIQAGASCLEKVRGGKGVLLGGVPGVAPANVVVLGGGVVGSNAVCMAMGMGAFVTVLDISLNRLQQLDFQFGSKLNTIYATKETIEHYVQKADLVIGAVLVPGAAAPKLVSKKLVHEMSTGSVVVDVAIDQGGCFATSRPTTHDEPIYVIDEVVHYCVTNMPSGVPRTATFALNNATLPFIVELAEKGYRQAMLDNPHLRNGLNIHRGTVTYQAVAEALNQKYTPAESVLK